MSIIERDSTTLLGQDIERDATFGFTPRFFRKRAVFKKTSTNTAGTTAFPKAESDALDLKHNDPVNIVVIKLDTNTIATVSNLQVKQDSDGFFRFTLPDSVGEELGGYTLDMIAPVQFVVSKVGIEEPNPINQISPLGSRRRYTSARLMVYKSRVSKDDEGIYVTIEPNERDFFGVSEGDIVSVTTLPLETSGFNITIPSIFKNSNVSGTVRNTQSSGGRSLKVYISDLGGVFGLSEGDLVQVFGISR